MTRYSRLSKCLTVAVLSLGVAGAVVTGISMPNAPARALGLTTVFDPSNYAQNLLTAARALQQINNQIQSLQNQATMITNMSKNLQRIDFPQLQQITQDLQQIDRLMGQAQGIDFHTDQLDQQYRTLFPQDMNQALTSDQNVINAKARLDAAMAAYRQTMGVQSQVVTNVQSDVQTLNDLAAKSQNAEGALQAQQATNQLLALSAKQQFQIQSMMAAQYRAQSIEQARRAQAAIDARAATTKFLGSGSAYTPQ